MLTEMMPGFIWIGFYHADKKNRNLILSARGGRDYGDEIIPFGNGPIGRTAVTHQVFLTDTAPTDNHRRRYGVMCRVAVPLLVNGMLEGAIGVDSGKKDEYIEEEIFLIEDVGDIVADHIQALSNRSLDNG
jgi:L-methionine (R)-S-oxide reductase